MPEETLRELIDDIEFAIDPIKNIVRNLQPPLLNFEKVTRVATWRLWTPESETEGVSEYIGGHFTYVSPHHWTTSWSRYQKELMASIHAKRFLSKIFAQQKSIKVRKLRFCGLIEILT
jgi:hypothetical protein